MSLRARALVPVLSRVLDPLRARARRDELRELARTLAARGLRADAPGLALALALLDQADLAAARRATLVAELDALGRALAAHGPAAADDLLDDHLRRQGASRADRRARARALDADAVAERDARALARADGLREVCLVAAGALGAEGLAARRLTSTGSSVPAARTHGGPPAAGALALDAPPPRAVRIPAAASPARALERRLLAHGADRGAAWTVRTVALEGLARVLGAVEWPADEATIAELVTLADDATDHRWVQIAAVRALGAASLPIARERARARVLAPTGHPDDALIRARLVRILVEELHDPAPAVALVAVGADPSEHVRQSAARACLASGDPSCAALLARLSTPGGEASPRVRAVVAQVLASRARGSAGQAERLPAVAALAQLLRADPDPLPRLVGADAAVEVCLDADVDRSAAEALVAALDGSRSAAGLPPTVVNALARAAERARVRLDADRARLREALAAAIARLPEAGARALALPVSVDDATVGRTLAELAQGDFGLYAWRDGDRLVVRRGDRLARRAWRLLHELTHPAPTKRQGHVHTVGRVFDAPLRAHPAGLAEVTRTRVPGERVFVDREGGWGPYLPLVDDLLSVSLGGAPARLFTEHGHTLVEPPPGLASRMLARAELTARYAELAALRLRALEAGDAPGRAAYHLEVSRLGFRLAFVAHPGIRAPRHVRELLPAGAGANVTAPGAELAPRSAPVLALAPLGGLAGPLGELAGGPGGAGPDGLASLAAFTAGAAALFLTRSVLTRAEVRAHRRAIPLVIGGWGTRGKSGVERLKAALFHALGYEVLVKTTGCEATVLLGVPGRPLEEVPLYRPYGKATIWEQRDVLRLGGARRPQVLLWECMALNPRYVDLLQRGWMRDDYSTLTNAYPDHEDVQGPAGIDVARVIAGFTPRRATLVTAEEQMLPVLRERARAVGTRLVAVAPHDHLLLPDDLTGRFPYQEHPRNLALVAALAAELGVDPEVALVEMAEHVLPDIGGLKAYGPLPALGRRLTLINGMSANERASALGNWRRLALDRHDPEAEPGRWIVALVNNRGDRAARALTFAEAIVEELGAHRFALVGSGVGGLRRAIADALARRLRGLRPAEVTDLLARLKVGPATATSALTEVAAWLEGLGIAGGGAALGGRPALVAALTEALAASPDPPEAASLAATRAAVRATAAPAALEAALVELGIGGRPDGARTTAELVEFALESWARRRVAAAARAAPDAPATRDRLRELFEAAVVVPPDPLGEPDDLIDFLARACPPGARVDVMGLQNIKGPGLALVYRFAEVERIQADLAGLGAAAPEARAAAARRLQELGGAGRHALRLAVDGAAARARDAIGEERAVAEQLARQLEARAGLAQAGVPRSGRAGVLASIRRLAVRGLDHVPSVSRRRRADALLEDLARGRVSSRRAARELGRLLAEGSERG